jgi:branched-chain amino acid transport system ATP-binding protein
MLEVEGLSASYGAVNALSDVWFSAQDNAVTAVLGANGAGKTTLLRTMTGLVKARSGRVLYNGMDLTKMSVEDIARSGVGHVPEGRGVIQELTVEENLRLGGLLLAKPERKPVMEEVYERFPALSSRRRRAAFTLSGGERQMLAIGRALMSKPKALLLDEPSLGLAPLVVASIMELLRDLAHHSALTVVLVEQNATTALSIATNAVVLSLGRVVLNEAAAVVAADADLRHHYLGF